MSKDLSFDVFLQHVDKKILETSAAQKNQLGLFLDLLIEWNSKINLISRNEKNIIDRHFLNSACVAHFFTPDSHEKIIDIGSGGGFPGIILKILFPHAHFVLIDSIKKKTNFLKLVVRELGLTNIDIINDRAENISSLEAFYKSFDFVTARAVSSLDSLISLSDPFLKQKGKMLFLKGRNYEEEITKASFGPWQFETCSLSSVAENQDGVILLISMGKN